MALELDVSKIKNTVTFAVDKTSMKAAKDSILEIKKFAENIDPAFKVDKIKQQMAQISKEYEKLQKGIDSKPLSPKVVPQTGQPRGVGNGSNPRYQPGRGGNTPAGDEREARQRARRIDSASVSRDRFFSASMRSGALPESIDAAQVNAAKFAADFEKGEISARRLTVELSKQLQILRDEGKQRDANYNTSKKAMNQMVANQTKLDRQRERDRRRQEASLERQRRIEESTQERRRERLTDAAMGLNPRMLAGGLGIAAAVEGISRVVEGLQSTAERVNLTASGARNVDTNPMAIQAITAYGQANGIDSANIKKAIDNIKDVRERVASSVMSATLNKKGQYTGGDSGVDQVMNTFGWNTSQIKQFQGRPLDFLQAIENEGQRRGMNPAQIGHLMENLGDDLMHYEPAFRNGGAEILKFAQEISDSGANINDATSEAAKNFMMLNVKMGLVEQGLGNNFLVGFMDGFKEDTGNFAKTVKELDVAAKWLGFEIGDLATQFGVLVNSISGVMAWLKTQWPFNKMIGDNIPTSTNPQGNSGTGLLPPGGSVDSTRSFDDFLDATNNSGWGNLSGVMDRLKNSSATWDGLESHQFDFLSSDFNSPQGIGYQSQNSQLPINANVVVPDNAINVIVAPDGSGLSDLISAHVDSGLNINFQQMTLDNMSSTSIRN